METKYYASNPLTNGDSNTKEPKEQDTNRHEFIHDFYLVVASALVFLLASTIYNALIVIFQALFGPNITSSVVFQIFFVILITVLVITVLLSRALFFDLL